MYNYYSNNCVMVVYSNKTIYFIPVYHIRSLIEYYNSQKRWINMNKDTQYMIHELNHDKCYSMNRYFCEQCDERTHCKNKIEDNKLYVNRIN